MVNLTIRIGPDKILNTYRQELRQYKFRLEEMMEMTDCKEGWFHFKIYPKILDGYKEKIMDIIWKSELISILRVLFKLLQFFQFEGNPDDDQHLDELERYCKIGFGIDQDDPTILFE